MIFASQYRKKNETDGLEGAYNKLRGF